MTVKGYLEKPAAEEANGLDAGAGGVRGTKCLSVRGVSAGIFPVTAAQVVQKERGAGGRSGS